MPRKRRKRKRKEKHSPTKHVYNLLLNKFFLYLQPWSQGLEKIHSIGTHFAPPHPCAMLTKHLDLTQVCILLFSYIERGNGRVDTYSVGITIMISCFWHFPTQFVQGCGFSTKIIRKVYKLFFHIKYDIKLTIFQYLIV